MKDVLESKGDIVNIKGHNLHIYRQGDKDKANRVIVIEKFGYGYSDICEFPSDVDTLVNVQKHALEKLGETGPYILMPHSMSGIEAFVE